MKTIPYIRLWASIIILTFPLVQICSAQDKLLLKTTGTSFGKGVSKDSLGSIAVRLENALNQYNKFGRIVNPQTGQVDAAAIDNYRSLFNLSAEVVNDVAETPSVINPSDFASYVLKRFPKGLDTYVYSAVLDEIRYDSAGYYIADVLIEKRVKNIVKGKNQTPDNITGGGRCFVEKIQYDVPVNGNKLRIQKIQLGNETKCPPENKTSTIPTNPVQTNTNQQNNSKPAGIYFGPEVRFGLTNWSFSEHPILSDKDKTIYARAIELDPGAYWGLGARLQIPLGTSQKFYFISGIGYLNAGLTLKLDSLHYQFDHIDLDGDSLVQDVRLAGLKEDIRMNAFELSPGVCLGFGKANPGKIRFMTDVQVLLRLHAPKADLSGKGEYRGIYENWELTVFDDQEWESDYGYNRYPVSKEVSYESRLLLGFRLAPNVQIPLSKGHSIFHFGVEYEMLFGSPIATIDNSEGKHILRFRGNQEINNESIGFNYLKDVGYSGIGLRAGLLFNLLK